MIVLAGKEYGTGSSRDWAAKGTYLLGVKAVLAESFERIHRSNLVGMGVLPLQYRSGQNAQGLGITHNIALGFQAGYGFDSIALALLGKSHPAGVLGASLLFGVLRAGAARMQSVAGVPTEIVQIVQSLVIVFIAAPAIIRAIYRLREARQEEAEVTIFSRGWGS